MKVLQCNAESIVVTCPYCESVLEITRKDFKDCTLCTRPAVQYHRHIICPCCGSSFGYIHGNDTIKEGKIVHY